MNLAFRRRSFPLQIIDSVSELRTVFPFPEERRPTFQYPETVNAASSSRFPNSDHSVDDEREDSVSRQKPEPQIKERDLFVG
jgi:hypothetical protein